MSRAAVYIMVYIKVKKRMTVYMYLSTCNMLITHLLLLFVKLKQFGARAFHQSCTIRDGEFIKIYTEPI